MAQTRQSVKIINSALDALEEQVILRGVISPESLALLLVDDYQREVLSRRKILGLKAALIAGDRLPDIELGMRGSEMRQSADIVYLQDLSYIVDGLQRITAAREWMLEDPEAQPHIGATIYLETTVEWERDRFETLNAKRDRVSANVLLRNSQHKSAAIFLLVQLSTRDTDFVLFNRIQWTHNARRNDLISAAMFVKAVGRLHGHLAPTKTTRTTDLAPGLDKLHEKIGSQVLSDNVKMFFKIIDEAWGLRDITYVGPAAHVKLAFLRALALLLSEHKDFWQGDRLVMNANDRRKLKAFKVYDPSIVSVASAAGASEEVLFAMLVKHMNSGRRTGFLHPRYVAPIVQEEDDDEEDEAGALASYHDCDIRPLFRERSVKRKMKALEGELEQSTLPERAFFLGFTLAIFYPSA